MSDITSPRNPKFKKWQSLLEAKGIKAEGLALLCGRKLIKEFLEQNSHSAEEILLPPRTSNPASRIREFYLPKSLFNELDIFNTGYPLLVVRTPALTTWNHEPPKGLRLIIALSDPGNLGAVLRSAEAFGVNEVVLSQEACSPYLPKAIRASSGACFRLPLKKTGKLTSLPDQDLHALALNGENLATYTWPKDVNLVLGEEGQGLPDNLAIGKALNIPMTGKTESLNAVVAASIALWSYQRGT